MFLIIGVIMNLYMRRFGIVFNFSPVNFATILPVAVVKLLSEIKTLPD